MAEILNFDAYGDADAPPVIIAHGLYGAARNFRSFARQLSRRYHVICVDMRNHGDSFWSPQMDYHAMGADLVRLGARYERPALIGHSMGGKAAMAAALQAPETWAGALIADIAPVAYSHGSETAGHAQTMAALDLSAITDRKTAVAALTKAVGDAGLATFFAQNLEFDGAAPRWRLNLAVLIEAMAAIVGFPDDIKGRFEGPAFFLSGATSDYVTDEGKEAARALFPNARFAALKEAGHWLHADQPRAFLASLEAFLDAVHGAN